MTKAEMRRHAAELAALREQCEQLANDLSQTISNNRDLTRELDRWRANAFSAFAALQETREMMDTRKKGRR